MRQPRFFHDGIHAHTACHARFFGGGKAFGGEMLLRCFQPQQDLQAVLVGKCFENGVCVHGSGLYRYIWIFEYVCIFSGSQSFKSAGRLINPTYCSAWRLCRIVPKPTFVDSVITTARVYCTYPIHWFWFFMIYD